MTPQQRLDILRLCVPLKFGTHSLNVICQQLWQVTYADITPGQTDELIGILQNLTITE